MSYQNPFPFKLPDPPPTTPYSDFFDAFPSMKPASFQAGQIPVADGPQAPGHLPADPSVPPVNPLKALLDAIQSSQNAYQQAAGSQDAVAPPIPRSPSLGSKDLVWGIPALLGLLSGPNGQQLAAGLIQGGLQQNKASTDAANQAQMAQWQFGQAQRENATNVAAQGVRNAETNYKLATTSTGKSKKNAGDDEDDNAQTPDTVGGPSPIKRDFMGRYNPSVVQRVQSSIRSLGDSIGPGVGAKLLDQVSPYPLEVQSKMAKLNIGSLLKPNKSPSDYRNILAGNDLAMGSYLGRLLNPFHPNPLTPQEFATFQDLAHKRPGLQFRAGARASKAVGPGDDDSE